MIHLPVSATGVMLRLPNGADEMAFHESGPDPFQAALCLMDRIVLSAGGSIDDRAALTVTDFEILTLHLRRFLLGPAITSHVRCKTCGERVEISFGIQDYIDAVRPSRPARVTPGPREGWFTLNGAPFRLPTVADLRAARASPDAEETLRGRCVAAGTPMKTIRAIERAMARLAPPVTGETGGACPDCGAMVTALFDVVPFVVSELGRVTGTIHAEIHLLASAYHWDETAILALPGVRRRRYASLVRGDTPDLSLVA